MVTPHPPGGEIGSGQEAAVKRQRAPQRVAETMGGRESAHGPKPLDATRRHSTPLDATQRRSTPLDAARRRSTPLETARRTDTSTCRRTHTPTHRHIDAPTHDHTRAPPPQQPTGSNHYDAEDHCNRRACDSDVRRDLCRGGARLYACRLRAERPRRMTGS